MKTVLKIFRHDVHDIFTHLFVLITLLAVAVMPLHYAMDALRECVGGMYGNTYWKCLGSLLIFAAVFFFVWLVRNQVFTPGTVTADQLDGWTDGQTDG